MNLCNIHDSFQKFGQKKWNRLHLSGVKRGIDPRQTRPRPVNLTFQSCGNLKLAPADSPGGPLFLRPIYPFMHDYHKNKRDILCKFPIFT